MAGRLAWSRVGENCAPIGTVLLRLGWLPMFRLTEGEEQMSGPEEMKSVIEAIDHNNTRQRKWLFTKIMEAAPQSLTVPE